MNFYHLLPYHTFIIPSTTFNTHFYSFQLIFFSLICLTPDLEKYQNLINPHLSLPIDSLGSHVKFRQGVKIQSWGSHFEILLSVGYHDALPRPPYKIVHDNPYVSLLTDCEHPHLTDFALVDFPAFDWSPKVYHVFMWLSRVQNYLSSQIFLYQFLFAIFRGLGFEQSCQKVRLISLHPFNSLPINWVSLF